MHKFISFATKTLRHEEELAAEGTEKIQLLIADCTDYTDLVMARLGGPGESVLDASICGRFTLRPCVPLFNGTNLFLGTNFGTWPKLEGKGQELIIDC